jgi:DNA-binding transcriptional ArsR family regulator
MTYQLDPATTDPSVFRAISEPRRRAILDLLRRGGRPVCEIAADFEVSRPAISQHLKVLLEAGLVRERREGRRRVYALDAAPLAGVEEWLESYRGFWERNLAGLKEFVEAEERARGPKRRRRQHGRRQD